ncbi:MAG: hypothetical protein FWF03_04110, partial [Defluviitaleaceae bacterium]|nr:hypothetical protein [Defluviitaleaceae bacterium]
LIDFISIPPQCACLRALIVHFKHGVVNCHPFDATLTIKITVFNRALVASVIYFAIVRLTQTYIPSSAPEKKRYTA